MRIKKIYHWFTKYKLLNARHPSHLASVFWQRPTEYFSFLQSIPAFYFSDFLLCISRMVLTELVSGLSRVQRYLVLKQTGIISIHILADPCFIPYQFILEHPPLPMIPKIRRWFLTEWTSLMALQPRPQVKARYVCARIASVFSLAGLYQVPSCFFPSPHNLSNLVKGEIVLDFNWMGDQTPRPSTCWNNWEK